MQQPVGAHLELACLEMMSGAFWREARCRDAPPLNR
jgi:hypothetical protein